MSEKMTLEHVSAILKKYALWGAVKIDAHQMSIGCSQCADAIDAHLSASKAQTVDIDAIREVIKDLRGNQRGTFTGWAEKLAAALPKDQ